MLEQQGKRGFAVGFSCSGRCTLPTPRGPLSEATVPKAERKKVNPPAGGCPSRSVGRLFFLSRKAIPEAKSSVVLDLFLWSSRVVACFPGLGTAIWPSAVRSLVTKSAFRDNRELTKVGSSGIPGIDRQNAKVWLWFWESTG